MRSKLTTLTTPLFNLYARICKGKSKKEGGDVTELDSPFNNLFSLPWQFNSAKICTNKVI